MTGGPGSSSSPKGTIGTTRVMESPTCVKGDTNLSSLTSSDGTSRTPHFGVQSGYSWRRKDLVSVVDETRHGSENNSSSHGVHLRGTFLSDS